jgi:hypothetical protein
MLSTHANNKSEHSVKSQSIKPQQMSQAKPVPQVNSVPQPQPQPQPQQTINVVNITKNESNNLVVEHDKVNHKFIIYDNSNILGHFTIGQIFKYINSNIEGYLINVDLGISVELIEKYLIKADNEEINIISHLSSPITGNIDLLVKLYKDIQSFEPQLQIEYEHLNNITKNTVRLRNKTFVYNILTHIIKLFATYTSTNKKTSEETKSMIMSYSIGAVYRLNTMIKEDIDLIVNKVTVLSDDLGNLKQIRENMSAQMNKLQSTIATQNEKIDSLITNIQQQKGGANTTTTETTVTTETTHKNRKKDEYDPESASEYHSETDSETDTKSETDSKTIEPTEQTHTEPQSGSSRTKHNKTTNKNRNSSSTRDTSSRSVTSTNNDISSSNVTSTRDFSSSSTRDVSSLISSFLTSTSY